MKKITIIIVALLVVAGAITWGLGSDDYNKSDNTTDNTNEVRATLGEVTKVEADKVYFQSESGEKVAIIQASTKFVARDSATGRLDFITREDIKPGVIISVTYAGSADQKEVLAQFVTILKD